MLPVLRLLRSWPAAILILLLAVHAVVALFVPALVLIEIGDAFVIPMAFAALLVYGRTLLHSLRERQRPDYIDTLVFGIAGVALVNSLDRTIRLGARLGLFDLLGSPAISALLLALTYFAALHILVRGDPRFKARRPPPRWAWDGRRVVICALAWGVLFSILIMARHLN